MSSTCLGEFKKSKIKNRNDHTNVVWLHPFLSFQIYFKPQFVVRFIILTKLWVVSGTFSKTSTWSSSPVNQEMSVSQPMGFFSLMWAGQSLNMKYDLQCDIALACFCSNDGNVCVQNTVLTHPEPCKPHSILGSGLASSEPSLRSLSTSSHSELEPETHT